MDIPSQLLMSWPYGVENATLFDGIDHMDYFNEIAEQDFAAILGFENQDHPVHNHSLASADLSMESTTSSASSTEHNSARNSNTITKSSPYTTTTISNTTTTDIHHGTSTTEQQHMKSSSSALPDGLVTGFGNSNVSNDHHLQINAATGHIKEDDLQDHQFMNSYLGELRCDHGTDKSTANNRKRRVGSNNNVGDDTGAPGPITKRKNVRAPQQSKDHIIAERKRREKLNQFFIALSALLPDLKRMDKTSVLEHAIKHVKQLQERVKILEEESAKKPGKSVVVKHLVVGDDDEGSHHDLSNSGQTQAEIEARFINKSVLLKIQFEKRKGYLVRVFAEIEKLNLTIVTTHAVQFFDDILDITVVAQMDVDFHMTPPDVVKKLRSALRVKTTCKGEC